MTRFREERGFPWGVLATIGIIVVIALIVLALLFHRVTPGNVGIFIDYSNPLPGQRANITPIQPGRWVFVGWNQDLQSYPFSQQSLTMVKRIEEGQVKADDSVECKDKTGIQVNVDMTVIWKVIPEEIGPLYLNYPDRDIDQIRDQLVRRLSRQSAADACGQYGFIDIAGTGRIEFGQKTTELLGPRLREQHIELVDVSIGEVYLLDAQQQAITDKSIAEQKALQAKFLEEQRKAEASALIAQAEGDKQAAIIRAQGQAEAARVITEQLGGRDYYIRYLWIDKWNGAFPYMLVTSDGQQFSLITQLPEGVIPPPASSQTMPTATVPAPTKAP